MSWKILLSTKASRELRKLPQEYLKGVKSLLLRLKENPFPRGHIKLQDLELFRIRFGRVRIVYQADYNKNTVLVFKVGLRKEGFYKRI